MRLTTIALKNLQRRKARALFLVVGLLIGVATAVTLLSLSEAMTAQAQHKLENFGANILITPRTDNLSLSYGGITLGGVTVDPTEIAQADLARIDSIPNRRNVAAIAPKVLGAVTLGDQRMLLMGVDPRVEFALKKWWTVDGRTIEKSDELVLGSETARRTGLALGDSVTIAGFPFRVVGVLQQTGSQDDHLLVADLTTAQTLLGKVGKVSLVEVAALCANCPIGDMVHQLSSVLPQVEVHAIQQVVKTRMHALEQFRIFAWGVAAVVVAIGALVVFVTMMGSVNERTREIGIFRALGFRRWHVVQLILCESVVVSALAGVLGYLGGIGSTRLILPWLSQGMDHDMHEMALFDPLLAVAAVFLAILVGMLASVYPALHASRLDPTEALRAL